MDFIQLNEKILLLWDSSFDLESSEFNAESLKAKSVACIKYENIHRIDLTSFNDASFTIIIIKSSVCLGIPLFAFLLKLLKPSGRIVVPTNQSNLHQIFENLKLAGFVNATARENDVVVAEKPKYEIGSAVKLSFGQTKDVGKTVASAWKLSNDDSDLISEDDLLDESDKVKPNSLALRVCETTGKRKACKDCSCGLADELASESTQNVQSVETVKSSCGSCYLGDAFRCASCPYLGMPAFKPGEKIQLSAGLLKDDL